MVLAKWLFNLATTLNPGRLQPIVWKEGSSSSWTNHPRGSSNSDYAINKCRHMCFGQRLTWVTNCYALKFVLSYDGCNSAILCLQMRFMCWDMDIEHRNDFHLVDTDYWSRLGTDLCFDPLLKDYIQRADFLRKKHPSLTKLPMLPKNQPYYWPPRNPVQLKDPPAAAILHPQDIVLVHHDANKIIPFLGGGCPNTPDTGMQYLSNWPASFGNFSLGPTTTPSSVCSLYNSDLTAATWSLSHFDWAVYGFNSGHFISSIHSLGLLFAIVLASDDYAHGRSLFT
jgi:hypothetical protein